MLPISAYTGIGTGRRRRPVEQGTTRLERPSEGDSGGGRMIDEGEADFDAAEHDLEDVCGKRTSRHGREQGIAGELARPRMRRVGLDHDGAAGGER